MNVLKEIQKGTLRYRHLLENDIENAKQYKVHYREEVGILIAANDKFMDQKVKELEEWCKASEVAWSIPQKGIKKVKRRILMEITNNYIDKISKDIFICSALKEELERIRSRFDGFIFLTK